MTFEGQKRLRIGPEQISLSFLTSAVDSSSKIYQEPDFPRFSLAIKQFRAFSAQKIVEKKRAKSINKAVFLVRDERKNYFYMLLKVKNRKMRWFFRFPGKTVGKIEIFLQNFLWGKKFAIIFI